MGGFQYYEFQTVDRTLSSNERKDVQGLSSRGNVTKERATFIYNYGDFKHRPEKVLADYFDAMIYVSNFGCKTLMFKLPKKFVNRTAIGEYEKDHVVDIEETHDDLILSLCWRSEEGCGWIHEEDVSPLLTEMIGLRQDILLGDFRALYLAHIAEDEEDADLPSVPDNLQNLSPELESFVKFFELDRDSIKTHTQTSVDTKNAVIDISAFSESEVRDYLTRMLNKEPMVDIEIMQRVKLAAKS